MEQRLVGGEVEWKRREGGVDELNEGSTLGDGSAWQHQNVLYLFYWLFE
jgi:hypothetical protein